MNRYPLTWPQGWRRTPPGKRMNGKFNKSVKVRTNDGSSYTRKSDLTVYDSVTRVLEELRMFGVLEGDAIISTNLPVRLDGLPRSDARKPQDPGVAVYWERPSDHGKTKVMAIDAYDEVADNLAAIAATLEAMRAIERHGGAVILDRAFEGFVALMAPGQTPLPWRDVLEAHGVNDLAEVERLYKEARSAAHPDTGGNDDLFNQVQRAWKEAQEELR